MKRTVLDLQKIAASGGGFSLDASTYTTLDLQKVAASMASGGGRLVLRNLNKFTTLDLQKISASGKGCVFLEALNE